MTTRKGLFRLIAVMATVFAMLVPATAQAAGVYTCGTAIYDASNPAHLLYGATNTTLDPVNRLMLVDLSGHGTGMTAFWDGTFPDFQTAISGPGGSTVTVVATTGANIKGSAHADFVCGTTGNDRIAGRAGNDTIYTMNSSTVALAGYSPSTGRNGDQVKGGKGDDTIINGSGGAPSATASLLSGGKGSDTILGGADNSGAEFGGDWILGGGGDDTIWVYGDNTVAFGKGGNDSVKVPNRIASTTTPSFSWAGVLAAAVPPFSVVLNGNNGDDSLALGLSATNPGTGYRSAAYAGKGNDTIAGGGGFDGPGSDQWMEGNAGNDTMTAGSGLSCLGTTGAPCLTGAGGTAAGDGQILLGGPGDDTMTAGHTERALLVAGDGGNNAYAGYPLSTEFAPTYAPAAFWPATGAVAAADYLAAQRLYGDDGNDTLKAYQGTDPQLGIYDLVFLFGGVGNDAFFGGQGQDHMFGSDGNNTFNMSVPDYVDVAGTATPVSDIAFGGLNNDIYVSFCEVATAGTGYDQAVEPDVVPPFGGLDSALGFWPAVDLLDYTGGVAAAGVFETIGSCAGSGSLLP